LADSNGGLDPDSAGYRAIAQRLGLTAGQLTAALGRLKGSVAGS
jgi:hypothetical protein